MPPYRDPAKFYDRSTADISALPLPLLRNNGHPVYLFGNSTLVWRRNTTACINASPSFIEPGGSAFSFDVRLRYEWIYFSELCSWSRLLDQRISCRSPSLVRCRWMEGVYTVCRPPSLVIVVYQVLFKLRIIVIVLNRNTGMSSYCSVDGCLTTTKTPGVSFFRCPKDSR